MFLNKYRTICIVIKVRDTLKNAQKFGILPNPSLHAPPPNLLRFSQSWEKICWRNFFNLNHSKSFETFFRLIKICLHAFKREGSSYLSGGHKEWGAHPFLTQIQVHIHYRALSSYIYGYFSTYLHDLDVWESVQQVSAK